MEFIDLIVTINLDDASHDLWACADADEYFRVPDVNLDVHSNLIVFAVEELRYLSSVFVLFVRDLVVVKVVEFDASCLFTGPAVDSMNGGPHGAGRSWCRGGAEYCGRVVRFPTEGVANEH